MSGGYLILLALIAPLSAAAVPATPERSLDHEYSSHTPDWSPDGRRIAFTSGRLGTEDVFVMAATGEQERPIARTPGLDTDAVWSSDGSKIAFESQPDGGGPRDIYVVDVARGGVTRLTRDQGGASARDPSWSPDGTRIAIAPEPRLPASM